MDVKARKELVVKFARSANDTSSPEVQIALLDARLNFLNSHFSKNPKDHHSRRGLLKLVGKRRKVLNYLQKTDNDRYQKFLTDSGIRG